MAYVSLNLLFRQQLFLLIALLFIQFNSTAQNLVPNPSFEEHDGCPNTFFNLSYVNDWFPINGTPDYFHKCSSHGFGIPYNVEGFQNTQGAFDSAYIGEGIIPRDDSVREIIGVELTQSLQIGKKYFVSFYFSPTNNINSRPGCFCNKMGVQLFVDAPSPNPTGFPNKYYTKNFSIITSDTVYSDTLSWHLFSGSFIADSSYRYFAVGNFFSRDSLTWFCRDPLSYYVYTFFDNFCLSPDSALCLDSGKSKNNSSFNLYYDNSSQTLHIGSQEEINNLNIKIYSLLGQRLIESVLNGNTIAINLSSGVYFAILNNQLYKFIVL